MYTSKLYTLNVGNMLVEKSKRNNNNENVFTNRQHLDNCKYI